ncbi:titin-like [Patiria miniata]|uniref:Ig-like domain-containing protein n=1 Tax=Patiria miniata TaxID=46514 RepID=A0A914ALC5_PATMI|nr:titin-like [Patiria miniata]
MALVAWSQILVNLLTIAVCTTSTSATVQMSLNVQDAFPVRYSTVELTCSCTGRCHLSEQSVVWTKGGQPVAQWPETPGFQTPAKYELSHLDLDSDGFFAFMEIKSIDTADNGLYRCRLQSDGTVHFQSNQKELTIEQRPSSEYPECTVRPVRGGKALICDSERGSPPVSLQWWKDGQPLEQSTPDDDLEDFVQARLLVADDESSRGRFECALTFRGELTGSCILDRPNVTIPTTTSGLSVGQDLVVVCVTSGNPASTVDWNFRPNLQASVRKEGHVLTINNVSSRDNGTEIICEGHNAVGSNQASTVITLRPLQTTVQPIAVQLEQTKIPTSVDEQAQFKCVTIPARLPLPPCVWHYNGLYIDPSNTTDRFLVEDRSEHVLSVSSVSTLDVGASVTCRITISYQPIAEVVLKTGFPLTTEAMTVATTSKPSVPLMPKLDDSSNPWKFDIRSQFGYIIGGLMCLVLIGIGCWVALKAKSLLWNKRDTKSSRSSGADVKASCIRLDENNFMVDIGMARPAFPNTSLPPPPSLVTKQVSLEQESPYQDLEDVSRQLQHNDYQRLISNVWMPPPVSCCKE